MTNASEQGLDPMMSMGIRQKRALIGKMILNRGGVGQRRLAKALVSESLQEGRVEGYKA